MSGIQSKITRYAKKENVIYNEEKNQSIENNPEMTQITGLADKDIKTAIHISYIQEAKQKTEYIKT